MATKVNHEDRIVRAVSAMNTWAELKAAMDRGYVPTVLSRSRAAQKFTRLLRARGYRVFDGQRTW